MNFRMAGLVAHSYILAAALAVGQAFGAAWSLIPLAIGLLIVAVAE